MNSDAPARQRDDFGDLFEEAPIPYVHEAMDSRFIRMNRAARLLLGVRPREVALTFGHSLVADTPDTQARLQEAFASIRRGLEVTGAVLEMRRKDNHAKLWVEWSSKPAPNGCYTRTVLVDITQRVLIERTRAALEFSLESGQVGDWDLDLIHDTSRRSQRHDRCFGYSRQLADHEWGAKTFIRHVHPDDRERVARTMNEAIAQRSDWGAEFRVTWPDASVHWLAVRGNIYRTTSGGLASRMLGIVMDITERKRTEEALAASEELARGQVRALTRTIDALANESAPDRLLEHVLSTITEQFGAHSIGLWRRDEASAQVHFEYSYQSGRLITRSDPSLIAEDLSLPLDSFWPWPAVFDTGSVVVVEDIRKLPRFPWQARLVAGGVVTFLVLPMAVGGRVTGALSIRFTHERGFRSQEVELAQALVNQAMLSLQLTKLSAQSREAAVVAERNRMARDIHDTLAQGFTGVIVQLEAAADAQARGLFNETDRHIARASGLARESLTEARRSVRALRPQELDERDLCEALEVLIHKMTAGTPVRAGFAVEGTPAKLHPQWEDNLLRAVTEIMTNVLRHSMASAFDARIAFRPGEVRLDLRDNGCGFDLRGKYDGFGLLGVRERVKSMQGSLALWSQAGHGTRYSIAVPLGQCA